ncbi:MAG: SMC-Scp complex subunit ScpB [Verrucomicrobia bacterium]|nr:SMC-Scp complex subunit ScpB [Verrucomicrobiota bacterium]
MRLDHIIEALLFASPKPLTTKEIVRILVEAKEQLEADPEIGGPKEADVLAAIQSLREEYRERAFQLSEQVNGWTLVTRPEFQVWVRKLFPGMRPTRLSPPALETLAIIAYRQPITKSDIEAIRGVSIDGVLQRLLDAGLTRIAGRAEIPGRPLLYQTTQHFMEHFGLRTLEELPNASELRKTLLPISGNLRMDATSPASLGAEPTDLIEPKISNKTRDADETPKVSASKIVESNTSSIPKNEQDAKDANGRLSPDTDPEGN